MFCAFRPAWWSALCAAADTSKLSAAEIDGGTRSDLGELLAKADVQTIVGIPEAHFNLVCACKQEVTCQGMVGSSAVSELDWGQPKTGDKTEGVLLLQKSEELVRSRVRVGQRVREVLVEGYGLAARLLAMSPVG